MATKKSVKKLPPWLMPPEDAEAEMPMANEKPMGKAKPKPKVKLPVKGKTPTKK